MKKYKLGDLIRKVEGNKNKQLKDLPLLGINIEKEFMPSVANTIGTDMSNYQIVKKEQFACNPMHLGRDERMPTALLLDRDEILVSPAYFVFEIIDKNIILPEYLMLYFKRPETDRLLWFKTDSSVRGGLGWNEFCAVELFIPSIEKQKKIVEQYNQITESIRIKERLNNNLEQQAQAIFKSWFVDFEPFNRVMPSNWEISDIYNVADIIYGAPFSSNLFNTDKKGAPIIRIRDLKTQKFITYTEEIHPRGYYLSLGDIVVGMDGEFKPYFWSNNKAWLNQRVCVFQNKNPLDKAFVYYSIKPLLQEVEQTEVATTVIHIGKNDFDLFKIILPSRDVLDKFGNLTSPIIKSIINNKFESLKLEKLRDILLPKLMLEES